MSPARQEIMSEQDKKTEVVQAETMPGMAQSEIHAGFPSPASDYMTRAIDLNKELVRHPAATFYGRVVGDSMIDAGVNEGDINYFQKEGFVFKTYEGKMIQTGVKSIKGAQGTIQSNEFKFSVEDENVAQRLNEISNMGVRLH